MPTNLRYLYSDQIRSTKLYCVYKKWYFKYSVKISSLYDYFQRDDTKQKKKTKITETVIALILPFPSGFSPINKKTTRKTIINIQIYLFNASTRSKSLCKNRFYKEQKFR